MAIMYTTGTFIYLLISVGIDEKVDTYDTMKRNSKGLFIWRWAQSGR